jgi:hypothetical protein
VVQELIQRRRFRGQVAVLDIAFQQSPPFQETTDALGDILGQVGELLARRRLRHRKRRLPRIQ